MSRVTSRIRVSKASPTLFERDGKPFFYLGDTAWALIQRLTFEQTDLYFSNRAERKFNVVWTNVLHESDGLRKPNCEGELPFYDLDPKRPNDKFFRHLDRVIDLADQYGLTLSLLPTWGDKLTAPWGDGPRVFRIDDMESVRSYARFIAERYAKRTNVIWTLGGDRPPTLSESKGEWINDFAEKWGLNPNEDWRPIWDAFAEEILRVEPDSLITYHPQGGPLSTSPFLHDRKWLHYNSIQSGHGGGHDQPIWEWITRDLALDPKKPTMDAEPNYEDHPVSPWPVFTSTNGYYRDYDVRKQNYRSVFAGAAGVVYGHHAVWQMWDDRYEIINFADRHWTNAIHRPGAAQMKFLAEFMTEQTDFSRIPDQSLLLSDEGVGGEHIRAFRSSEARYAAAYVPKGGRTVTVRLDWASGRPVTFQTFDPRTGSYGPKSTLSGDRHEIALPEAKAEQSDIVLLYRT